MYTCRCSSFCNNQQQQQQSKSLLRVFAPDCWTESATGCCWRTAHLSFFTSCLPMSQSRRHSGNCRHRWCCCSRVRVRVRVRFRFRSRLVAACLFKTLILIWPHQSNSINERRYETLVVLQKFCAIKANVSAKVNADRNRTGNGRGLLIWIKAWM